MKKMIFEDRWAIDSESLPSDLDLTTASEISLCSDGLEELGLVRPGAVRIRVTMAKEYTQGFRRVTLGSPQDEDSYGAATVSISGQNVEVTQYVYELIQKYNRGNPVFVKVETLGVMQEVEAEDDFGTYTDYRFVKVTPRKRTDADRARDRRRRTRAKINRKAEKILDTVTA